jgi:hypothetical protein
LLIFGLPLSCNHLIFFFPSLFGGLVLVWSSHRESQKELDTKFPRSQIVLKLWPIWFKGRHWENKLAKGRFWKILSFETLNEVSKPPKQGLASDIQSFFLGRTHQNRPKENILASQQVMYA